MKRFIGWFNEVRVGFITGGFVGLVVLGLILDMFLHNGDTLFGIWGLFGLLAWSIALLIGVALKRKSG